MTIICFGDSITYGNWDPEGGWVGRLRNYLDSKSLNAYSDIDLYSKFYTLTYNQGIPGDTSTGLFARFENELTPRFNPDEETIILFAIGINDSRYYISNGKHETDLEEFGQNIWDMWEIARQYTNDVAFIGLTPVDEDRTNPLAWEPDAVYKNDYIQKYDEVIKDFCNYREIPFIDIFSKMIDLNLHELMEDGIHPNANGYKIIEEIIRTGIFENRK
jgi:lysophospholipase L1-like esterase